MVSMKHWVLCFVSLKLLKISVLQKHINICNRPLKFTLFQNTIKFNLGKVSLFYPASTIAWTKSSDIKLTFMLNLRMIFMRVWKCSTMAQSFWSLYPHGYLEPLSWTDRKIWNQNAYIKFWWITPISKKKKVFVQHGYRRFNIIKSIYFFSKIMKSPKVFLCNKFIVISKVHSQIWNKLCNVAPNI